MISTGILCCVYFVHAVFAAARVYAVDGGRWAKASVVVVLGIVPATMNIYQASQIVVIRTPGYCS